MDSPKISNVELFVTEACNLSCKYCFHVQRDKHMSMDTLEQTMAFLEPYFAERCDFSFFGGEPMLRPAFILQAADKIRKRFPEGGLFISTNATVFSMDIVKMMNSGNRNTLQVSYDGLDQQTLRGAEETVLQNMHKYVEHTDNKVLTVRMTYTPETVGHLADNIAHMHALGIKSVMHGAEFSDGWTPAHMEEYRRQLNLIYDFIRDKPDFRVVFADCKSVRKSRKDAGCKMGKQMIAVSAEGDIYPCHRAVAHTGLKIGNVYEERMNRGIFMQMKMEGCETCAANGTCAVCYVANYEYSNNLRIPMKCSCDINKMQYEKALLVYEERYGGEDAIKRSMIPVLKDVHEDSLATLSLLKSNPEAK